MLLYVCLNSHRSKEKKQSLYCANMRKMRADERVFKKGGVITFPYSISTIAFFTQSVSFRVLTLKKHLPCVFFAHEFYSDSYSVLCSCQRIKDAKYHDLTHAKCTKKRTEELKYQSRCATAFKKGATP